MKKNTFHVLSRVSLITGCILLSGCTNPLPVNQPAAPTPDPEIPVGELLTMWYRPGYSDMNGGFHKEVLRKATSEEDADGGWVIECSDKEDLGSPTIDCVYSVPADRLLSFESFLKDSNLVALGNRADSTDFVTDYSPWSYSFTFDNSSVGGNKTESYYLYQYKEYSDADRELLAKLGEEYKGLFGELIRKTEETVDEDPFGETEDSSEEGTGKESEGTSEDETNEESEGSSEEGTDEESEGTSEEGTGDESEGTDEDPEGISEEESHVLDRKDYEEAVQALRKLDHRMNGAEAIALLGAPFGKEITPISHPTSSFFAYTLGWKLSENYTLCAYFFGEGSEENARLSNVWIDYDDGTFTWGGVPVPWEIREDRPEPSLPEGFEPVDLQNEGDPEVLFARLKEALSQGSISSVDGAEACEILGKKYSSPHMFEKTCVWDYENMRVMGISSSFLKRDQSEESDRIAFDPKNQIIYLLLEKESRDSEEELMEIFDQVSAIRNRKDPDEVWEALGPAAFSYYSDEDGYWFFGDYLVSYNNQGKIYVGFALPQNREEQNVMLTIPNLHQGNLSAIVD